MKILLIFPPSIYSVESPETRRIEKHEGGYPPLGLLYIASYLIQNTDHEIEVIDAQIDNLSYSDIKREIKERDPELVGVTTTSFTIPDAIATTKIVKSVNKDIHVNLGGPHIQIYPRETLRSQDVDSVTIGEGEITFTELADSLVNNEDLKKVRGLMFKKRGNIICNDEREPIKDLDYLLFPARNLLPVKKYSLNISKKTSITSMIGSKGCIYGCNFCSNALKRIRYRSPKSLVDEIEECINMGIQDIQFYDNTFTINKKRTQEICEEIIKRKLRVNFGIRTRTDCVHRELIKKLKKAGCVRINYGVESATKDILEEIGKDSSLDRIKKVFRLTKDEGIDAISYFMIGFPDETRKDIMNTIDFAQKLNPDYCIFSMLTPYPGTKLYSDLIKRKVYNEDYWKNFAVNPLKKFTPKTCNKYLNRIQLTEMLKYAYKKFYLRPEYVFSRFNDMTSITQFKNHLQSACSILRL